MLIQPPQLPSRTCVPRLPPPAPVQGAPDRPTVREHLLLVGEALAMPGTPAADASADVADAAAGALSDYLKRWGWAGRVV
jgi:hypothetical protein